MRIVSKVENARINLGFSLFYSKKSNYSCQNLTFRICWLAI